MRIGFSFTAHVPTNVTYVEFLQDGVITSTPHSVVKSCSLRQHSREVVFGGVYPLIGGLSGRPGMNLVSLTLKCSRY